MIEPPSRFLDEYAFRQGHYNSRGKPIFTLFNGKYVLKNTLIRRMSSCLYIRSSVFQAAFCYSETKHEG